MSAGFTPAPTVVQDEGGSSEFITILGVMSGVFLFIMISIGVCCWRLRKRTSEEGRAKAAASRQAFIEYQERKRKEKELALEHERLREEDPFYQDHLALDMLSNIDTDLDGTESRGGGSTHAGATSSLGDPLLADERHGPGPKGSAKEHHYLDSDEEDEAGEELLRRWEEEKEEQKREREEMELNATKVPEERKRTQCRNSVVRMPAVVRNRPKDYIHPVELGKIRQRELHENIGKESYEDMVDRLRWIEEGKKMKPALPLLPFMPPEKVGSVLRPLAGLQDIQDKRGEIVHPGFHRLHGVQFEEKRIQPTHPIDFGNTERIPPPKREAKFYVDLPDKD